MKVDFRQLRNTFISSNQHLSLIEDLEQIYKRSGELADDQIIVSSKYPDAVICDVFFEIYGKNPKKILTASTRSKIVSFV